VVGVVVRYDEVEAYSQDCKSSPPSPLFIDDEFVSKYLRRGRKYQITTILVR